MSSDKTSASTYCSLRCLESSNLLLRLGELLLRSERFQNLVRIRYNILHLALSPPDSTNLENEIPELLMIFVQKNYQTGAL